MIVFRLQIGKLHYLLAHFKSKKIDLIVKPFDIDLGEDETRKLFLILDIVEES